MIEEHETHKVQDATKIQTYMACPRLYFYEYVLGWRNELPSLHLEFGTAWHLAMEQMLTHGLNAEACLAAYEAFANHYRQHFDMTWDEGNAPKIPANVLRALPQYCVHYKEEDKDLEVLHIEVAGSVPIDADKHIYFKTDTICRGPEGIFSLEHKTGSRFSTTWANQWRQKMQVGVYTHVLYSMYDESDVFGVKINGAFFSNPPKIKKDGNPYAGARDNEFMRLPLRRSLESMDSWLVEVNHWYDSIQDDFSKLASVKESDDVMKAFPRNTESCTRYGQCPFLDYCSGWHNPLQHVNEPPLGYHVQMWDPRGLEHVRKIMEL